MIKSKARLYLIKKFSNLYTFLIPSLAFLAVFFGFYHGQALGFELENVIQFEIENLDPQVNSIQLKLNTKDDFKIYKDNLSFELSIPDTFPEYLTYQSTPKEKLIFDSFSNTEKYIFENGTSFTFKTNTQISDNAKIVISVQGCSSTVCLLPGQLEVPAAPHAKSVLVQKSDMISNSTQVSAMGTSSSATKTSTMNERLKTTEVSTIPAPSNASSIEAKLSDITQNVLQTGGWLLFPLLFLAGLLTNLTPCVYPMIPITIGVMDRFSQTTQSKFRLVFAYFLGMVVTYSLLGVFAAMTGQIFGSQLASPTLSVIMAVIMILLGFAMLDFFDLGFIQRLSNKMPLAEKSPVLTLITMGALSGLVAAPCTGPILSMILVLIAQTRNPLNGLIYMLCFSIGFGAPYIVLGLISQKLTRLPKMHRLSLLIKFIFACLMFAMAFYFLKGILKDIEIFNLLYVKPDLAKMLVVIVLLLVFFFAAKVQRFQFFSKFARFGSLVLLTLLSLWLTLWISNAFILPKEKNSTTFIEVLKGSQIRWQIDLQSASQQARELNKKILVDVWAEWCTACLEMESTTWKDAEIIRVIEDKFVPVKFDYTHPSAALSEQLNSWKIVGLPAILVLDPKENNKPLEVNQGLIVTKDLLQKLSKY